MRNIKMILEYDGTGYHGWQRQSDRITIQQVLEESIGTVTREKITVTASGRTDAGVHAINQTANFRTGSKIEVRNLHRGINSLLPGDIVIKELAETDAAFHARYDVKSKVYLYQILNGPVRPVLCRRYAWFVRGTLNPERMTEAAAVLSGTHDFASFCAADCGIKNHVRTVKNISMETKPDGIIKIYVEADGFLRHMVRNIVGTLVDAGRGKVSSAGLKDVLAARDRRLAGATAPAHGLFLKEVKY